MMAKILAAGVLLAVVGGIVYDRDAAWVLIAGPPDLGPVDFPTLEPPTTPNHYLVCPEEFCARMTPAMVAPVYRLDAAQLQSIAREVWSAEPGLEMLASDPQLLQDRYVQRTPIMRFPDTISVRFIGLEEGSSTLAVYSRSQIGQSDLGVNEARVLRLLSLLDARVTDDRDAD